MWPLRLWVPPGHHWGRGYTSSTVMHFAGDICCTAVAAVQCSPMDCGCSATYRLCIAAGTTCWANNIIVTEDEGDISPLPGEIMEKHQEPHTTGEDEECQIPRRKKMVKRKAPGDTEDPSLRHGVWQLHNKTYQSPIVSHNASFPAFSFPIWAVFSKMTDN